MGTDIHTIFQAKRNDEWFDIPNNYDEDRHYSLFAWLADVRQGNSYIKPIAPPRGLPADFAIDTDYHHTTDITNFSVWRLSYSKIKSGPADLWLGYHSHSWLLGSEILANIPKFAAKQAIVGISYFRTWDKVSPPETYAADVLGPDVHIVTPDVVDYYKATATHVRVCWLADLEQEFRYFTDEIKRLMDLHGEIRMVFGFDS